MTTPTKDHVELRSGAYADSVTLLQVSRAVQATPGVVAAQVAMATGLNLEVLEGMGFDVPGSSPNDMVVALRLDADADVVDRPRRGRRGARARPARRAATPRSPRRAPPASALRRTAPGAIALVSVPGASATVEAMDALEAGRDVMVFSDNVPVAEEVALKRYAASRGALVMGPDCGTAVVDGVGLGFANAVRPGRIGIVAASGTGCQQLLALLHHAGETAEGVGVRHALGVGGRDLSSAVGGLATREALRRLDADPDVDLVVVVSKPPAPEVAEALTKDDRGARHARRAGPARPRPARPHRGRRGRAGAARPRPRRSGRSTAPTTPAPRPGPCCAGSSSAARSATSRC